MELLIVIAIIALAGAYAARNFYRKFRVGRAQSDGCGCSGCSCTPQQGCDPDSVDGRSPDACPVEKSTG